MLSDITHVEERTVTIHVLRVGKKQFTATLFKQLPVKHPIDEWTGQLNGTLYGRVLWEGKTAFVLWEEGGNLFRYQLNKILPDVRDWKKDARERYCENDSLRELICGLERKGATISLKEDNTFFYRAPKGIITPEAVAVIRENKEELISVLLRCQSYQNTIQASYTSIQQLEQLFIGV